MCAPEAPDTSKQDAIADRMGTLTEKQWSWVQDVYAQEAPTRKAAADMAMKVAGAQLDTMGKQNALADESAADYRRIYRPMEERAAAEASTFDSEARQAEAAGKAVADVRQQHAITAGATERNMASMGINASDGAFAAGQAELNNQATLQAAHGANLARDRVQTVGRAMRNDVISTGRGVVGTQGSQAGLTLTAGGQAVGSAQVPVNVGQSGAGMVQTGYGQAMSGLGQSANIYAASSNSRFQAEKAGSDGLASLAGAGMSAAAIF